MNTHSIQWVIIITVIIYLMLKWSQIWFGQWEPFNLASVSFCHGPAFFEHFLLQNHLILFLLQLWPWVQPFLQGALIVYSGEWYLEVKIGVLGVLFAIGVAAPMPFQGAELQDRCMYAHVHRHKDLHLYLYLSLSIMYIKNHELTLMPPIQIQIQNRRVYSGFLFFFFFPIYKSFLLHWESLSSYPNLFHKLPLYSLTLCN